jgi:hypothetical protein
MSTCGRSRESCAAPSCCRHIDRNDDHIAVQLRDGFVNPLRSAPIDRDPRTAAGQPLGDREADALVELVTRAVFPLRSIFTRRYTPHSRRRTNSRIG